MFTNLTVVFSLIPYWNFVFLDMFIFQILYRNFLQLINYKQLLLSCKNSVWSLLSNELPFGVAYTMVSVWNCKILMGKIWGARVLGAGGIRMMLCFSSDLLKKIPLFIWLLLHQLLKTTGCLYTCQLYISFSKDWQTSTVRMLNQINYHIP